MYHQTERRSDNADSGSGRAALAVEAGSWAQLAVDIALAVGDRLRCVERADNANSGSCRSERAVLVACRVQRVAGIRPGGRAIDGRARSEDSGSRAADVEAVVGEYADAVEDTQVDNADSGSCRPELAVLVECIELRGAGIPPGGRAGDRRADSGGSGSWEVVLEVALVVVVVSFSQVFSADSVGSRRVGSRGSGSRLEELEADWPGAACLPKHHHYHHCYRSGLFQAAGCCCWCCCHANSVSWSI